MRPWAKLGWVTCIAGFLFLALDGALHWDEPAYLYTGGFLSFQQILDGQFQPSGIKHFYFTRPLHILIIFWITNITGVGVPGLVGVLGYATLSLVGFLVAGAMILRRLLPDDCRVGPAIALGLWIPVVPYLAFKSLPEPPALLCAAVGMYALIRGIREAKWGRVTGWGALAALMIALTLWFKGPMLLLIGSGVPAVLLFACRGGMERVRLLALTVLAGLAGLGIAYAGVVSLGVDPSIYTGGVSRVGAEYEPISARILNNGTQPGLFLIMLPLALFSRHKRALWLFMTWFILAAVPLAVLFPSMEARYQSPNVLPLIGLTALALDAWLPRLQGWWLSRPALSGAGLTAAAAFVLFSHWVAISVMQHEIKIMQVQRTLDQLDERYGGEDEYALLASWMYSDYLYLRFVYPDRPVYSAHDVVTNNKYHLDVDLMRNTQEVFFADRLIEGPDDLARAGSRVPVLFGFHENFAAQNLRGYFDRIPGKPLEAQLAKMNLNDHLATSWLWASPDYKLEEVAREGHYRAFEVAEAGLVGPEAE